MQTASTTTGVNMAVKNNFNNGNFTWEDVFNTQDALDNGILGSVAAGTTTTKKTLPWYERSGSDSTTSTANFSANASNFGSMLSMNNGMDASTGIAAYKKRRNEQTLLKSQGVGNTQSILGGSVV